MFKWFKRRKLKVVTRSIGSRDNRRDIRVLKFLGPVSVQAKVMLEACLNEELGRGWKKLIFDVSNATLEQGAAKELINLRAMAASVKARVVLAGIPYGDNSEKEEILEAFGNNIAFAANLATILFDLPPFDPLPPAA